MRREPGGDAARRGRAGGGSRRPQLERGADGTLQFRRPDGRALPDVPAPPVVPADPAGAIRAQNAAQGLTLHARTGLAQWFGERLDVRWAIDVLHPRAAKRQAP